MNSADEPLETYGLNWRGKRAARELAQTPSGYTMTPCADESVFWETTQNILIEGDNLDALKLLQENYAGKIKLIYIDPPYNTNDTHTHADTFAATRSPTAEFRRDNLEASGRRHSNWLTMMYPRLMLARNLLTESGVMIVHIDEHEAAHLEQLVREIFGEENLLGVAVWDKKNPKGDAAALAYQHESILFAAKNKAAAGIAGGLKRHKKNADVILTKAEQLFARLDRDELPDDLRQCAERYNLNTVELEKHFRRIDLDAINAEFAEWMRRQDFAGGERMYNRVDERGDVYRLVSMAWPNKRRAPDAYFIPLQHPVTKENCPVPKRGWRNPPETMERLMAANEIVFGADHTTQPQRKYFLKYNLTENFPSVLSYGGSDDARLAELGIPFDNPKPLSVAMELIASVTSGEDIVLDFFAGSGTAGHAVYELNRRDRAQRRFVLVQMPEPLDLKNSAQQAAAQFCVDKEMPLNIAEITKARLRRAGKGIGEGDVGFRVFKLEMH